MVLYTLSEKLYQKNGIWFSPVEEELSYPEDANDLYFQIEDDSFWFQHRNRCIGALINRFSPNEVFHDIGGGNGAVSYAVQKQGVETVLIEPGIKGCLNAKKRGVKNVVCSTFQHAFNKDGQVKLVGMFDVLEHIDDEIGFLKELNHLMVTGGKVVLTVPAYQWLWSEEDSQVGHFRRYTQKMLADSVRLAGFTPVYSSYLFSFLPLPIFMFRSIPYKLSRKRAYNDQKNIMKEHGSKGTPKLIQAILNMEQDRVTRGASIAFGSTCIMVVSKD